MPSEPTPAQQPDEGAKHRHQYAESGVCMLCHPDAANVQLVPCPYWHAAKAPKSCLRADPFVRCLWCGVDGPGGEDPIGAWNRRAPIPPALPEQPLTIRYTNHRGETSVRNVIPQRLWFGATEWHPEPQWLLDAHDVDKDSDRTFALSGVGQPASPEREAVYIPDATARDHDGEMCGAEFGDLDYAREGNSTFCEMLKGHAGAHVDSSMAGRIAWMTPREVDAAIAARKESD